MVDVGRFTYNAVRRSQKGPQTLKKGDCTATDEYTVVIPNQKHPEEVTITGLPKIGDKWDLNNDYKCTQIIWQNTFPSEVWTAQVLYHVNTVTQGTEPDPGDQPEGGGKFIYKSFSPHAWNVDLEYDAGTGRAVQNTARIPFDQAITAQVYTTTITIKAREKSNPATKINTYQGTINSAAVPVCGITIGKHCGFITLSATETGDGDYPWEVTYTIMVAKNVFPFVTGVDYKVNWDYTSAGGDDFDTGYDAGFDALVLNTGFSYLKYDGEGQSQTVTTERFVEPDKDGNIIPSPMPKMLNNKGEKEEDSGKRYWCVWQRYPEAAWSSLKLPTTDDPINVPDDDEDED